MKLKSKQVLLLIFLIFIPYLLTKVLDFEKNLTIVSIIFVILIFISYRNLGVNNQKIENLISRLNSVQTLFYVLSLIAFILISQNYYLIFEIVTWDVPSYLVGSQEIKNGSLPFETQWESKGPLLTYLYYLFSKMSGHSYIHFRVISDLILILLSVILFFYSYNISKNKIISSITSLTFASMCSMRWYVSEYSEYFSLLFVGLDFYLFSNSNKTNSSYIFVGILIGVSSLINQASVLFVLPYIIFSTVKLKYFYKSVVSLFIGGFSPHLIFIIIYSFNGLLDVYFANYISIPLGYSADTSESSIYEMRVWFREFYDFNKLLYFSLIGIIFGYLNQFIISIAKNFKLIRSDLVLLNLLVSLVIYFVAAHNYAHHLIYFIFFVSLLALRISKNYLQIAIAILIFIGSSSIFVKSFDTAFYNLNNLETVQKSYPMHQLATEIKNKFDGNSFNVFALDYLIVLYYLEKPNYSYIVHPTNHFADYITDVLEEIGKIEPNNVNKLLDENPDVIICSPKRIHNGKSFKNEEFSCDPKDYSLEYSMIETEKFRIDPKLEYYWDPYRSINVFVKLNK